MNKTKVLMKQADEQYGEWEEGDTGYIDGYLYSNRPYIVVIIKRTKSPVLVSFGSSLEVIE